VTASCNRRVGVHERQESQMIVNLVRVEDCGSVSSAGLNLCVIYIYLFKLWIFSQPEHWLCRQRTQHIIARPDSYEYNGYSTLWPCQSPLLTN
jgi:hypothetical protein